MIDDLTVRRMQALSRHWAETPPVHVTLAHFVGSFSGRTPSAPAPAAVSQDAAIAELLQIVPQVTR